MKQTTTPTSVSSASNPSSGQKIESLAKKIGSWQFIIAQSVFFVAWVIFNAVSLFRHWDPYPFIFMNLVLSLQAAYVAPLILISQNKQADHDRKVMYAGYYISSHTGKKVREMASKLEKLSELVEKINKP